MSLLGRDSTIDVALKDIRRGLADAEAFMEICRFGFKYPRPAPCPTAVRRRWDRPDFLDEFIVRPSGTSTHQKHRKPKADEVIGGLEEAAKPVSEPVPTASVNTASTESLAAESPDSADQPVEELSTVVDPQPEDEPDWPEMPDFLVRRN